MDNFYSDGPPEGEWEDRGELAWNEFDWERYLREQDEVVLRYLAFYEAFRRQPDRIDLVARQMGWEASEPTGGTAAEEPAGSEQPDEFAADDEVYTLHKHPVYVATRAIYLALRRSWELTAADAAKALALPFLSALHRGEDQAVQGIHALDFGDYAMAISLFKRALSAVNEALALLGSEAAIQNPAVAEYGRDGLPRLFDLREIWLRVIKECREELGRPIDEES
jgi:hypothetical protein